MHTTKKLKLPTHYQDLKTNTKNIPIEELFDLLEEFQEKQTIGIITENEQLDLCRLERCIELRLDYDFNLVGSVGSENIISEKSKSNSVCFETKGEKFIDNFISEYLLKRCRRTSFFISKNTLNYN